MSSSDSLCPSRWRKQDGDAPLCWAERARNCKRFNRDWKHIWEKSQHAEKREEIYTGREGYLLARRLQQVCVQHVCKWSNIFFELVYMHEKPFHMSLFVKHFFFIFLLDWDHCVSCLYDISNYVLTLFSELSVIDRCIFWLGKAFTCISIHNRRTMYKNMIY